MFCPVRPLIFLCFRYTSEFKERPSSTNSTAAQVVLREHAAAARFVLKYAPFGMAPVLDSVAPPSAQLVGESIRVHDDFFGDVNIKLLSFCPDLTSLASCCFCLPHTYLPHRARQGLSIPASGISRSGQTLVCLSASRKSRLNPVTFALGRRKRVPSSFDRTICPAIFGR